MTTQHDLIYLPSRLSESWDDTRIRRLGAAADPIRPPSARPGPPRPAPWAQARRVCTAQPQYNTNGKRFFSFPSSGSYRNEELGKRTREPPTPRGLKRAECAAAAAAARPRQRGAAVPTSATAPCHGVPHPVTVTVSRRLTGRHGVKGHRAARGKRSRGRTGYLVTRGSREASTPAAATDNII